MRSRQSPQISIGQDETGKALVYVFGQEAIEIVTVDIGGTTTRIGKGANTPQTSGGNKFRD